MLLLIIFCPSILPICLMSLYTTTVKILDNAITRVVDYLGFIRVDNSSYSMSHFDGMNF
jgi:hypothetical protein